MSGTGVDVERKDLLEQGSRTGEGQSPIPSSARYTSRRHRISQHRRTLAVLGCMVAVATTLVMMLPALSMTRADAVCGMQEHTHADACYEQVLVCGLQEGEDHQHADECYEQQLVCDLPEHTHTDACYEQDDSDADGSQSSPDAQDPAQQPDASNSQASAGAGPADDESADPDPDSADDDSDNSDPEDTPSMPAQNFQQSLKGKATDAITTVQVQAPEGALPEGTTMQVRSVTDEEVLDAAKEKADGEVLANAANANTAAGATRTHAVAVDITFLDAQGNPVEPQQDVSVSMTSTAAARQGELAVVHVDDALNAQVVPASSVDPDAEEVTFSAAEFSVYALVYTVDFYFEVDGKTYTYSIAGGSSVNLKDLLPLLGVVADDPQTEENELDLFEQEIQDVQFSDESLVKVAYVPAETTLAALKDQLGVTDASAKALALTKKAAEKEEAAAAAQAEAQAKAALTNYPTDPNNSDGLTFGPPADAVADDTATTEAGPDANTAPELDAATTTTTTLALQEADVIPAGSWVLISLQPFDTDEELTVTMQNGAVFTIKVTDEQGNSWDVWFDGTLGQSTNANGQADAAGGYYSGAEDRHVTVNKNNSTITLPTNNNFRHPTGYQYTLKGWYLVNPANGETRYYEPGATVRITHDSVFYANWVPTSYDKGPATGHALVGDTPSTKGFVTTQVFDYNELINAGIMGSPTSTTINQQGHTETWNANSNFVFISWNYNNNPGSSVGMPAGLGNNSTYRQDTLTTGIFNDNIKNLLFTPTTDYSSVAGRTYVGTGDNLFRYNAQTGEYYYDSDINAATYNQKAGRFYVYQEKELIANNDGVGMTNFLPFNDYPGGGVHAQNTGSTNYWFGMKNTIEFYLPDDVDTGGNKTQLDPTQNMQFKFSGDDDVWVFVDDKLVLDLGGVHNRAGGIIDFSTGTVTKFKGTLNNQQNAVVDTAASNALKTIKEGEHTLTVYYLERGSSLSNCSIYFNLQPKPKTLELSKRLVGLTDDERAKHKNEDFTFELEVNDQLYSSSPKAQTKDSYKVEIIDSITREHIEYRIITDGQITLKDGQSAIIPQLNRFDTFYVAEQQGTNMDQYEVPHAERVYYEDGTTVQHEEELYLKPSHSHVPGQESLVDWETYTYLLNDTEKVTFTNTLREKDLEVVKTWSDKIPAADRKPVTFTVKATIPGANAGDDPQPVDVHFDLDGKSTLLTDHVFTLEAPTWREVVEQLPATTNTGMPITYTVVEGENGFVSTVTSGEKSVCDVDVVKYWPDEKHAYWADNPNHDPEVIRFKLKQKDAELYYVGQGTDGQAIFNATGTWFVLNQGNGYAQRFRDVPANLEYTYVEDDENPATSGLSVFKRSLLGTTIHNAPMPKGKITVAKTWLAAEGNRLPNPPEGTTMSYQIYRVKHVHEWSDWEVTPDKQPTETAKGEEQRHCLHEGCDEAETRELEVIGHNWEFVKKVDATCETDGYELWRCTNGCGSEEQRNIVAKLGHDYDGGVITTDPVWNAGTNSWTPGVITYTCKNDPSHTYTETYVPQNLFPGTDIPMQDDATPTGQHDPDEKIHVYPSGIFKSGDNYYVIFMENASYNWAGFNHDDPGQSLVNYGLAIKIDLNGPKYDTNTFTQGDNWNGSMRNNMFAGDMYHDLDTGAWYIRTQGGGAKPPTVDMAGWYKIPGTGPSTSGDGTGANGASGTNSANSAKTASASAKLLSARRLAVAAAPSAQATQAAPAAAPAQNATSANLTTTTAVMDQIQAMRDRVGYVEGETTHYYYTVELVDNQDFQLPNGTGWSRTHDVDLKDEEGNPYTYYVVETAPTTGWITTYEGEPADGLSGQALEGQGATVGITNQQEVLQGALGLTVLKVDKQSTGTALDGAQFRLVRIDETATSASEVQNTQRTGQTANGGTITFSDLDLGYYQITELAPPAGYVLDGATSFYVQVTATTVYLLTPEDGKAPSEWAKQATTSGNVIGFEADATGKNMVATMQNTPGKPLPLTGGAGTAGLTLAGAAMALSAAVMLLRGRRQARASAHGGGGDAR